MPTNPIEVREQPSRPQRVAKSVTRFTSRHAETATYAAGVVSGVILVLLARLLP